MKLSFVSETRAALEDAPAAEDSVQRTLQPIEAQPAQTWTPEVMMTMSLSVLGFAVIILGLMAFLLLKSRNASMLLKTFGTMLIIVSAVFLVVAGYTQSQITPVIGLLGTIAGYLLGKDNSVDLPSERGSKTQS